MIGETISHYKIAAKIGAGGMGEVYLAEDTKLDRKVALKFLPPRYSDDPDLKSRFEHEAKAAAALNHPNIITVYELGEHAGRMYLSMELVDGQTLDARIASGTIKIAEAVDIAQQACEGLNTAHEAGIIHRDIKPANILIDKKGRVKILDFGLAKSHRATTETKEGTTLGTLQYESPEQCRGDNTDHRSDLFSVGVVLYEMIAARRPFEGELEDAVRYAIAHDDPEPLARYKANVPDDLQRIVSKLLEKDPELRYQSAAGVVSDLKQLRRTFDVHTASRGVRPQAVGQVQEKAARRRLLPILVPTTVVALVLIVLLVLKPWKLEVSPDLTAIAADDRIAVMYFDNLADPEDSKRNGEIVASLLISDLSESKFIQVVSTQRLYDILKLLGEEGTRVISPDIATQVAKHSGARWMVTGDVVETEPSWVVTAQLIEVVTGDAVASPTVTGSPGERVYAIVDRLTEMLKSALPLPEAALVEADPKVENLTTTSEKAFRLYLEAEELRQKLLYREAVDRYREAIAIDSTFAMAYAGMAHTMLGAGLDFTLARSTIERAVTYIDHANDRERQLILAMKSHINFDFAQAIERYEQVIAQYPDEKRAYEFIGAIYQQFEPFKDLSKAEQYRLKLLEIDSLFAPTYNSLAYIYDAMGDLERSIWAINKYIELQPGLPNPLDSRAELYANNGKLELARKSYLNAISVKPDFASSIIGAADMCIFLEDYQTADSLLQANMNSRNPQLRVRCSKNAPNSLIHQGRLREALELAESELKKHNESVGEDFNAIEFRVMIMSIQEVLREWEPAIEQSGEVHDFLVASMGPEFVFLEFIRAMRAEQYAASGQLDIADSLLAEIRRNQGPSSDQGNEAYLMGRGMVDYYRGDHDSALVYFSQSIDDSPDWDGLVRLGRIQYAARRFRDAILTLEHAAEIYDSSRRNNMAKSVLLHYWLAQAYEKGARNDDAVRQYERFLHLWRNADTGIEEIEDAKQRLAALTSQS